MELSTKTVMAYLRSNGSFNGRKAVELLSCTERDTLKIIGIEELEERKAKRITYEHPLSLTMLLTFVFDAALHEGALGVIKTPFLVFKRVAASREFVNIDNNDVPVIQTIISEIEDEQTIVDPSRSNNIVMAYYMAAGKKSGLLPIVISISNNENFQIPSRHSLMNNALAVRSCVVSLHAHKEHFLCIFDEQQHNDDSYNCPYLVFGLCHGYNVRDLSEGDIMNIVQVIQYVRREIPRIT
ncbi:hypothetical protein EV363DRAFT_1182624 [Boletus edulis]|uniref:Uncharacterized protein n=1 Tax=Boletus edulis BED1 TaxID=1328754 RepID=A0AAD4BLP6_BOLED|nr:hypothetical protein EV363DRAFT_1182624 [Boletus edulis]KAF8433749.1 hypothetical protein L210DRAFT_989018 [Boletus edulis BED1]